jgi:gamma-glutamyl hercynylcysteine S-oxide synthase
MARTATAPAHTATPSAKEAIATLETTRRETLALVAELSDEDLERVHSPIMSPLAWDLAHIAAYEDLWLAHRQWGMPLLREDLAASYDAFETPRAVRGEIPLLGATGARAYMEEVRVRTAEAIAQRGIGDGVRYELVLRHELQHSETMRQTLAIAGLPIGGGRSEIGLPAGRSPDGGTEDGREGADHDDERWLQVPAGAFAMGAGQEGFAYDNERPRHIVELPAFQIACLPVSCESWMRFVESGGYERREWWSEAGWQWLQEQDGTHHPAIARSHPEAPACHISWFEADAFARAHDARLPSEQEWEKAASCKPLADFAGAPSSETGSEAADSGGLAGVGLVWEWTRSHFRPYLGFVAYPYREYSEVFFGDGYRVLRGGSWATHPRVASTTFRNWDLPQRRQIFAGLRLARDA